MDATIERLRIERIEIEQAQGKARGREWVQEEARYEDLVSVASADVETVFDLSRAMELSVDQLCDLVCGWPITNAEAKGFAQGAREVWNKVKDRVHEAT